MPMVRQPPAVLGLTQPSSVMPVVRSSEGASATVTQSLIPSKLSAPPLRPSVVGVAPETVPWFPSPDASVTMAALTASNDQAPTRPGRVACSAYVARYVAAVAGAVTECARAPPSDQLPNA